MFSFFKKIPTISISQLQEKLKQPIVLIDVRNPSEYRQGHIIKAKNIPLNKIGQYREKHNSQIYVICQSGMRSKQATRILRKNGYDAVNISHGMNRWFGQTKGGN